MTEIIDEIGWGGTMNPERRWEGCHCTVGHLAEYCKDCYVSKSSHQLFVMLKVEEGDFYDAERFWYYSGGITYLITYEEFVMWAEPLLKRPEDISPKAYDFLKMLEQYFVENNKDLCELSF
jgi:hypothetical protein